MSDGNPMKFGGWAFVILGYAAMAAGIWFLVANTVFWIRAESVKGEVIGHEEMERVEREIDIWNHRQPRAVVVAFETREGRKAIFTTDWGSDFEIYDRGDAVTILYAANDPAKAKIRGFVGLYLGPLMLLLLGGGCWIAGTVIRAFVES